MSEPTLFYPDEAAVEAAVQRCIAGGYVPRGYEDAARARFRLKTSAATRTSTA